MDEVVELNENMMPVLKSGINILFIKNCDNLYEGCNVEDTFQCENPSIIYEDEFFPQQETLRNRYFIKCKIPIENSPGGHYQLRIKIPKLHQVNYEDTWTATQFISSISSPEENWEIIDGGDIPMQSMNMIIPEFYEHFGDGNDQYDILDTGVDIIIEPDTYLSKEEATNRLRNN